MTPPVERLASIFAGVNDWLKHAEAKNGVLVAANGAALLALLSAALQHQIVGDWPRFYLGELAIFLLLGLTVAFSAFLPVIRPREPEGRRPFPAAGNLLYFGDVAGTDPASYLAAVCDACGAERSPPDPMAMSYARQIVVNSEIGLAKYRRFAVAAWLTLAGVVTPPVALLYVVLGAVARGAGTRFRAWRRRRAARSRAPAARPSPLPQGSAAPSSGEPIPGPAGVAAVPRLPGAPPSQTEALRPSGTRSEGQ